MDFDHRIKTSNQSRVHIGSDWSGRNKHSDRHSEFPIGSRTGRLSSEGGGSSGHSSEESESSKYSRRHLDLDDEIESSKYPIRHLPFDFEVTSSGSSRHSDTYPDVMNNRGGNASNPFEISPELFKGWGNDNDYEIHPEVIDGSASSKRSEVIQEESHRNECDRVILSTEKLRLSSSSSSSSSSDDADIKLSKSRSGITSTSSPNFDKSLKDEHHAHGNKFSKSEESYNVPADLTWASQVSSVTHESTSTKSPPVQVMDRLGEYDPCRIPTNVFARNQSTAPADWSIASNDSLFSIQVGNNSFSRDHILNLKSGELLMSAGRSATVHGQAAAAAALGG
ncbi:hypothetical protein CCACVL1_06478 [Corchorus capsularis]|uniref:Uncharacterized protein n=1 Tax=Corchorus capsularis TaxID=210143 RepID=A0A1R3JFA8_COCAP|nr:hypothetical protein CCACVL1_06478 [Corchorus capsularis]